MDRYPPSSDDGRDLLTALPGEAEARAWLDAAGLGGFVQAMLVGLHRFRSVNIAYGRSGGDRALIEIAHRISDYAADEIGPDTFVARIGGGEFLVASPAAISRERWQWLAEAMARTIARGLPLDSDVLHLSPRTALLRGQPGEDGAMLLDRLDQALASLQQGRGRRTLWADGSHRARGRSAARLEADLIGSLARNEIGLVFQPQYRVADNGLVGAEALARWDHPQLGRIGAETLFAIAEQGDHVAQLSRHIARRALTAAARWQPTVPLSLNVTAEDLALDTFAERIGGLVAETGFTPESLTLEVTEQALVADFDRSAKALSLLAEQGVRIALDDFGTGYANFRTLKALPIDTLKLDASLVRDVDRDERDRSILRAMIAMARALGQKVVAEGVERQGQLDVLRAEGCDTYQGFLRSEPLPAEAIAALAC